MSTRGENTLRWRYQDFGKWASLTEYGLACLFLLVRICLFAILGRPRTLRFLDHVGWSTVHYWREWIGRRFGLSCLFGRASTRWGYVYFRPFASDAIYLSDEYEPAVTRLIERSSGKVFVDIGANIGRYALIAAGGFKKVIAIEPHHETVRILRYNLAQHKNAIAVRAAVSDVDGYAEFHLGLHSAHSSLASKTALLEGTIPVRTVRLVSLFRCLKLESVDLIKVDAEGAERLILRDSYSIMPRIVAWLVEVHPPNDKTYIESIFRDNGYRTKWVDELRLYAFMERP